MSLSAFGCCRPSSKYAFLAGSPALWGAPDRNPAVSKESHNLSRAFVCNRRMLMGLGISLVKGALCRVVAPLPLDQRLRVSTHATAGYTIRYSQLDKTATTLKRLADVGSGDSFDSGFAI